MEKPWLQHYPSGVPKEIDPNTYASIVDIFEQSIAQFPDKPAFSNFGTTLSYRDLDTQTKNLAAYLQDLKLQKNDRVAIMMPNLLANPIAIFATLRAGLTVVNVNPLYTARELRHQLKDCGAKAIVIVENFACTLQEVCADVDLKHIILVRMGDCLPLAKSWLINFVVKYIKKLVPAYSLPSAVPFTQALQRGAQLRFSPVTLCHDDVAFVQYTGGTTGTAKGAVLTHRNIVANVLQAHAWTSTLLQEGVEVVITALPLYHIFSLTANCLLFMRLGGHNHLITNPRDMKGFVAELKKIKFTAITGVNTLFNGLLNTDQFDQVDFSALKMTLGGGMAVQESVAKRWQEVTGSVLLEAYGLTETSPAVCINPLDLKQYSGKIGLPVPSTEVSIQDDEGQILAIGEAGELCVRGPQVMRGYWNKPDETAQVLSKEGWLRTGDVAIIADTGFVQIVDRKKDMILVSGFNVYPNEIESVVAAHEGVQEVGAIGVPDPKSTEAVKIVVVKKDPALTEKMLEEYCRKQLTAYKVPKYIEFCDELPKTNVGKILRRELRDTQPLTKA